MAKWCLSRNDLKRTADYCARTLSADASHPGLRDMVEEIEKRVRDSDAYRGM
jgi:hypothetical protein